MQGTGLATGTPDTLTVDITISTTEATAQAALAHNNNEATAVIAAFAAGGVTKQNIQTTGLSVQPNYTFTNGTETLTGYGVNNTVTAMITNLASAGSVIDAVSVGPRAMLARSTPFPSRSRTLVISRTRPGRMRSIRR